MTKENRRMIPNVLPYTTPEQIPLMFQYGDQIIQGIPAEFHPQIQRNLLTSNLLQIMVTGQDEKGLSIRAEYLEYRDFPVTEWVAYFTNKGNENTLILSHIKILQKEICGTNPYLVHGNGDNCQESGYEFYTDAITEPYTLAPVDGTPCNGAFPYMKLKFDSYTVLMAIGWPAQWEARFSPSEKGVLCEIGQQRMHMYLKPGETIRTPRVNMLAFSGSEAEGRNLWRKWYFKHILPKENENPIAPKLCLHHYQPEGKPEFTGATEKNQLDGFNEYIRRGMKPDIWWMDAGWYPCDYDWTHTGTWIHDDKRFPHGLAPIGKRCEEEHTQFLLWFEPERIRHGTWLDTEHPEWELKNRENPNADCLLNLGNPECLEWLIHHVDSLIKEYHVHVYRQDFNFAPLPLWQQNEEPDRLGALENFHVQGYLKYWDELILRNPGLWIDSCASGGRRNELETMRRAVPLHYTDVGYGNHPVKQKQHRMMFEWIPYFRAHNMSWDKENGKVDAFAFHCAMAPALTSMIPYDAPEEDFQLSLAMHKVWRRAASIMIRSDYYPLTECHKNPKEYYAMQFQDTEKQIGFVQVVRNALTEPPAFLVKPEAVCPNASYFFENMETGETMQMRGEQFQKGIVVSVPKRSGILWFYRWQ